MCKELHQDGSTSSRDEEGRAQDAPSLEDLMLEACHPRAHGMMKTSSKKRFPHGVWGSNLQVFIFIKQEHPRKVFPLQKNKTVYIKFKWDAQGKGMFLIGLLFCRSRVVSWETGFRIDSRTIKRGSQAGVSFASFGESSNLCIHSIIFLGCYLVLVHERIQSLWSSS